VLLDMFGACLEHLQPLAQIPDRRLVIVMPLLLCYGIELVSAADVYRVVAIRDICFVDYGGADHVGGGINDSSGALIVLVPELPYQLLQVMILDHGCILVMLCGALIVVLVVVVHDAVDVSVCVIGYLLLLGIHNQRCVRVRDIPGRLAIVAVMVWAPHG